MPFVKKFLPERVFVSKPLALVLLALHIGGLVVVATQWLQAAQRQTGKRLFWGKAVRPSPHYITYTLLVSNFVGIAFARTLHYQFYAWYFHALPYLLWTNPYYPLGIRILLLVGIELAFLTFPATPWSSAVLQLAHAAILWQIRPPVHIVAERAVSIGNRKSE